MNTNYSGPPQCYNDIRDQCLRDGRLFDDPAFPAGDQSYYLSGRSGRGSKFRWLRPHEIVAEPLFFSEGAQRFDVCQGELGNCWLLAAVANLTMNQKLLQRVVPHDQSFNKTEYAGMLFWFLFDSLIGPFEFQKAFSTFVFGNTANGSMLSLMTACQLWMAS